MKVYIVHRRVQYAYPNNKIEEETNRIDKIFDTKEKAVNYIRKEIVDWHDRLERQKYHVGPIVDETQLGWTGTRAYFMGTDGKASVLRHLYYVVRDVE